MVIVTGAAGFIGSHLARALLERGEDVVGIDTLCRDAQEHADNLAVLSDFERFTLRRLDLRTLHGASELPEAEIVFHLAGMPGVQPSWHRFEAYLEANVVASGNVARAVREMGARLVLASSSSVYGEQPSRPTREDVTPRPMSPYGVAKLAAEHVVRVFGGDHVVLRYFSVYGPRQRRDMAIAKMIACARASRPFGVYGTLEQARDFTFAGDAVDATLLLAASGASGETYNVGGGAPATLAQVALLIEELAGTPLQTAVEPARDGDPSVTFADSSKLWRLGWRPTVSLREGLERQLATAVAQVGAGPG